MDDIKPIPWRGFSFLEKLIIVLLLVAAAGIAFLPFLDPVFIRRLARQPGMRSIITWLVNDNGSWIVFIGLLALVGLFLLWKRHQLTQDKRLWFGTGCPNCLERELVRVSRVRSDRYYGWVGIPAYRYGCRNCTWRGLRIARREHSPELDAALEEALLRFDPNEPKPTLNHETIFEPAEAITESLSDATSPDEEAAIPFIEAGNEEFQADYLNDDDEELPPFEDDSPGKNLSEPHPEMSLSEVENNPPAEDADADQPPAFVSPKPAGESKRRKESPKSASAN